jgi:hypothetical protein
MRRPLPGAFERMPVEPIGFFRLLDATVGYFPMITRSMEKSILTFEKRPNVQEESWPGGAKVGADEYCFSSADLVPRPENLTLRLADQREYVFKPEQVLEIEAWPCGRGISPTAGIRIHHQVAEYPELIVFAFLCADPEPFVEKLRKLGFGKPPIWGRILGSFSKLTQE